MDYLAFPPVQGVRGSVSAPPSKSATNRALVLAAIGDQPVELRDPLDSEDTRVLARCLEAMGATVARSQRGLTVRGPLGTTSDSPVVLDAGSSGTAARFLAAVAAAVPGRWLLTGSARLSERPMGELVTALSSAGASVDATGDGSLPLAIRGATLRSGAVVVDAARSSQFFSALLIAAVAVDGGLSVEPRGAVVSAPYVDTTLAALAAFGHRVRRGPAGAIAVERGLAVARSYAVPGDWSSALPLLAAAGIAGGDVEVTGVLWPSPDADARAVEVLEAMGVSIERRSAAVYARAAAGALRPVSVPAGDFPDAVPALAALAAHAGGESRFRGIAHLRGKESDRLAALVELLGAAGAAVFAGEDELVVTGPRRPPARPFVRFPTFGDHRIAMSAALLSLRSVGVLIEDPGCVSKSYPAFFRDLETILVRG